MSQTILEYLFDNFNNGNFSDVINKLDEMNRFDAMMAVINMYDKFEKDDRRILIRLISSKTKLVQDET